jgi:hypothetical protein
MTMRTLIRTSALLTIFLVAIAGAEAEGVVFVEGCPWTCEGLDVGTCFGGWPNVEMCDEHIHDTCELVPELYGPACEEACQVADGFCAEDEDECETSKTGELWIECMFEDCVHR